MTNEAGSVGRGECGILCCVIREDYAALKVRLNSIVEWVKNRWALIAVTPFFLWVLFVWVAVGGDYRTVEGVYRLGDVKVFYANALVFVVLGLGIPGFILALLSLPVLKLLYHRRFKSSDNGRVGSRAMFYLIPLLFACVLIVFEPIPWWWRCGFVVTIFLFVIIVSIIWRWQVFKRTKGGGSDSSVGVGDSAPSVGGDPKALEAEDYLRKLEVWWKIIVRVIPVLVLLVSFVYSYRNIEFLGRVYEFDVEVSGASPSPYVQGTAIRVNSKSVVMLEKSRGVVQIIEVPRSMVTECKTGTPISEAWYINSGEFIRTCGNYDFDRACNMDGCRKEGKEVPALSVKQKREYFSQLKEYADRARQDF